MRRGRPDLGKAFLAMVWMFGCSFQMFEMGVSENGVNPQMVVLCCFNRDNYCNSMDLGIYHAQTNPKFFSSIWSFKFPSAVTVGFLCARFCQPMEPGNPGTCCSGCKAGLV